MLPLVLAASCHGYHHLPCLLDIARSGVQVPLTNQVPQRTVHPANHGRPTIDTRFFSKTYRRDAWRCIVVDADILDIWPEVHISPFGVVDTGNGDPRASRRVIDDLSYPPNGSVNDYTDQSAIYQPRYEHCDKIAGGITRQRSRFPDPEVKQRTGDVASPYRHICVHSQSVHLFGGRLPQDIALVVDLSAAFGWGGSSGSYAVVGETISFSHGHTTNSFNPDGFFSYHWADDHINVAADVETNCEDVAWALRLAVMTLLGPTAISED
ncbi:LOW QUALITY PROTEIN: hypothetical protein PHMEG_0007025 [Phytophthora megakarya]|uniref:Secreted protein n=1 Tax=Phytophthora megakarya TaxID=4795 RepID=A0A225WNH3_9STRA|nr:LOW QUALITY PROTEIN: hypothetical protein PHMEG_0007025 [Phytophthora megakarya]